MTEMVVLHSFIISSSYYFICLLISKNYSYKYGSHSKICWEKQNLQSFSSPIFDCKNWVEIGYYKWKIIPGRQFGGGSEALRGYALWQIGKMRFGSCAGEVAFPCSTEKRAEDENINVLFVNLHFPSTLVPLLPLHLYGLQILFINPGTLPTISP